MDKAMDRSSTRSGCRKRSFFFYFTRRIKGKRMKGENTKIKDTRSAEASFASRDASLCCLTLLRTDDQFVNQGIPRISSNSLRFPHDSRIERKKNINTDIASLTYFPGYLGGSGAVLADESTNRRFTTNSKSNLLYDAYSRGGFCQSARNKLAINKHFIRSRHARRNEKLELRSDGCRWSSVAIIQRKNKWKSADDDKDLPRGRPNIQSTSRRKQKSGCNTEH